jgi:TRAP-type uncharacterized transport system substrate-binding protein
MDSATQQNLILEGGSNQTFTPGFTLQNIIIAILLLTIFLYIYDSHVKPYLANIISKILPTKVTEAFTQYSSLKPSLSNTVQFDTNYYLRDNDKAIIVNNKISLPVIKYGLTDEATYEYFVGTYFRKHIYPINFAKTRSGLDIIYKFLAGNLDIAFVNEELLTRFIKRDCKYLTAMIKDNLGIKPETSIENNPVLLKKIYPDINISAIGIGFHLDFYLIVSNFSNIVNFPDIKKKNIGVWNDSYYDFVKLCSAWGMNVLNIDDVTPMDFNLNIEEDLQTLVNKFKNQQYDAIFIICHPKNKILLKLTLDYKVRFIHLQKRMEIGSKTLTDAIVNSQQGSGGGFFNAPPNPDSSISFASDMRSNYNDEEFVGKTREEITKIMVQREKDKSQVQNAKGIDINSNLETIFNNKEVSGQVNDSILKKYKSQVALHYNLVGNQNKEDFNVYIKKIYHYLFPKAVDLTKFYRSGNFQTYLETYSQRMVLMVRNEIPKKRVALITRNYIANLDKMRDGIDMENYNIELNNISSIEFKYDELISFDEKIPLHEGARSVYIKEGLIFIDSDLLCDI